MAGGLFSRIKNWMGGENLNNTDLNAEFNNIINNLTPAKLDNFSHTVSQMQQTLNPGSIGSEHLAASLAEEIEELRYQINALSGGAEWYAPPSSNISVLNIALNSIYTAPNNKIVSGAKTSFDQPAFLLPIGTASVALKATATPLVATINGALTTFPADITLAGLTLGPSAANTTGIADATLTGQQSSKVAGEGNSVIQIGGGIGNSIGSAIVAKNGLGYQGFKVGSEYFIGEVSLNSAVVACGMAAATADILAPSHGLSNGDQVILTGTFPAEFTNGAIYFVEVADSNNFALSATLGGSVIVSTLGATTFSATPLKNNCIKNCFRGYFFDASDNWIARSTITSGATLTLMQLAWLFGTSNGGTFGLDVTYNQPKTSDTQPSSPAAGDYWLDMSVNQWKKYNGTSYAVANALLIGLAIQDNTTCQGARAFDFYNSYAELNTMEVEYVDSATIRNRRISQKASVYGTLFYYDYDNVKWLTGSSLDTGVSLSANTSYWAYLSDKGKALISDVAPYSRKADLLGHYHPAKPWRCISAFSTDGSSNIIKASVLYQEYFGKALPDNFIANSKLQILLPGKIDPSFVDNQTIKMGFGGAISVPINGIDRTRLGGNQSGYPGFSSSTSTFSTTSTGFTLVTSIGAISLTGTKPVWVGLVPDGSTGTGSNSCYVSITGSAAVATFQICKASGSVVVGQFDLGTPSGQTIIPPSACFVLDDLIGAATVGYSIYVKVSTGTANVSHCKLFAYELA